jgi:alpha-1,3-rhamnosyl/mannosyltransferase
MPLKILYVGTIEPRKNIDRMLDAFAATSAETRAACDFVLAGPLGWCSEATARRVSEPARGVRYLGYVPEPDLPGLTRGAALFLFPSLYEGFGFPVVQAMACGVPVVTSRGSSLEETCGGRGHAGGSVPDRRDCRRGGHPDRVARPAR